MPEFQFNDISQHQAYRQEEYTDNKAGGILRLIPITVSGEPDPIRTDIFIGKTVLNTPQGPLELRFEIDALDLDRAFANWLGALKDKMAEMQQAAQRQRILNGAALTPSQARALAGKKP